MKTAALVFFVLAFTAVVLWAISQPDATDTKIAICPEGQHAQYIDSGHLVGDAPDTVTVLVGCEKNGVNL